MADVVLFGTGKIAEVVTGYLERDGRDRVVAYTVDADWVSGTEHQGRPVVAFEEVEEHYPPDRHAMFIALGYHDLNRVRAERCEQARAKGYRLISYVSPLSWPGPDHVQTGDNCLVLDGATIQPGATIGNDVQVWSSVVVGHHSRVHDHAWVAAGSMIGGGATIGASSFLGLSVTVGHEVTVGERCFLGAGTLVLKDAPARGVYIAPGTEPGRLDVDSFLKITKLS